ncbi:MAG: Uma2 family endonuclease [Candidatus Competibacteraceae bacterium]
MSVTAETIRSDAQEEQPVPVEEILPRHRWTVAEYHKMAEVGLLNEDTRVELIEGDIIEMAPIGSGHGGKVKRFIRLFSRLLGDTAIVAAQDPVVLGKRSEPQPDITILRWRDDFYESAHPGPEDILLVIEVADTTARYDHKIKVPLYARHGIPEVWLLDLKKRVLEIYRNPDQEKYQHTEQLSSGQIAPLQLPEAVIQLADLFPGS